MKINNNKLDTIYKALNEITTARDMLKNNLTLTDFYTLRDVVRQLATHESVMGCINKNASLWLKNNGLQVEEINGTFDIYNLGV